jgi:hypothetical protein
MYLLGCFNSTKHHVCMNGFVDMLQQNNDDDDDDDDDDDSILFYFILDSTNIKLKQMIEGVCAYTKMDIFNILKMIYKI